MAVPFFCGNGLEHNIVYHAVKNTTNGVDLLIVSPGGTPLAETVS
jgi:hypothetical protein